MYVQRLSDAQAQSVIRLLLYHGQMRAGDVVDTLKRDPNMSGAPSDASDKELEQRAAALRELLARMLLDSLVRPSTPVQHVSLQDRTLALESICLLYTSDAADE